MAGTINDIYLYNFNGLTIPWPKLKRPRIDWDAKQDGPKVINETIKFYYPKEWDDMSNNIFRYINYYNTEYDEYENGRIPVNNITTKFFGVNLSDKYVEAHSISDISLSDNLFDNILQQKITLIDLKIDKNRGFQTLTNTTEYTPASIIYDNTDSSSCLIVGRGYYIPSTTPFQQNGVANKMNGNISILVLNTIPYCMNLFYDKNTNQRKFHGFLLNVGNYNTNLIQDTNMPESEYII